jgi:hypothetical protein
MIFILIVTDDLMAADLVHTQCSVFALAIGLMISLTC